jgi:hypothetical protein
LYADRLLERLGAVPGGPDAAVLEEAAGSVAVADALAAADPRLLEGVNDAFLLGLHTGCLTIGALCLLGAAFSAVALPGRGFVPPAHEAFGEDTTPGAGDEQLATANPAS